MKEKVLTKEEVLELIVQVKAATLLMRSVDKVVSTCGVSAQERFKWHIHGKENFNNVCCALDCGYLVSPRNGNTVTLIAEYEDIEIFTLDYLD